MSAGVWADVVVAVHLAYVGFVVLGFAAVLAGGALGWAWVRNRAFRLVHLVAIALVAVEAVIGWICPLTLLEQALRPRAAPGSFVGRLMRALLYYDFPPWVFTTAYVVLTALAVALLWLVPPRRRGRG